MRSILRCSAVLAVLAFGAVAAGATPVQEFGVQLKDITAGGHYSLVITSNAFDTSGGPPPPLTGASVRLPKGISIKPQFLTRDRLCQTGKLKGILQRYASPGVSYGQALANLPATWKRIAGRLAPEGRAIVDACRKAFFGSGKFVVDARPNYPDPVPGLLYLFLSRPSAKGALAGVGVLSLYDRSSPLATTDPKVIELTPALTVNIFNDPTPDGRYGYRLKLLPERVGSLALSLAELRVETKGITATTAKGTCTARSGGKCVKRTVRKTKDFWATAPTCPTSGKLRFKADYSYATGLHTTDDIQVPCPRFKR